jgi:hypothetical protein
MRELGWPSSLQVLTDIASGSNTPDLVASSNQIWNNFVGVLPAGISGRGKATPWPKVSKQRSFSNRVISGQLSKAKINISVHYTVRLSW